MRFFRLTLVFLVAAAFAPAAGADWLAAVAIEDGALILRTRELDLRPQVSRVLREQLLRIPGATVRVPGKRIGRRPCVRHFRIEVAPDGLAPFVGRLVIDQSGSFLDDEVTGRRLALAGPNGPGREVHGARLWLTGAVVGIGAIAVAHWGVLIPP